MIDEGMIAVDSDAGRELGFTSDRFDGWLWKHGGVVVVSFIVSKEPGKGHFSQLLDAIWATGNKAQVPTPLGRMVAILQGKGFKAKTEWDENYQDYVELWERGPDANPT